MLNFNYGITDLRLGNIFNDVVFIINSNDDLRKDVEGDIKHIVVFVVDKSGNYTSFCLSSSD